MAMDEENKYTDFFYGVLVALAVILIVTAIVVMVFHV